MLKFGVLFVLSVCVVPSVCVLPAEVHTVTLKEAVDLALTQSPDVLLARLDERKAEQQVRLAKDPFVPKLVVGSGLAYSSGFPMSIEGATPSLFQASAIADVFNRPQSMRIAAAKQLQRGTALDSAAKQEEVAYRTATLFLDTENAGKTADVVQREVDSLAHVLDAVKARAAEGRELPIEVKKAELNLARARYRAQTVGANLSTLRNSLATLLGFGPNDEARPAPGDRPQPPIPDSVDTAVQSALDSNKELRSLEAKMLAKRFEVRAQRDGRLPRLGLVAQYAMLARYNNYEEFFKTFQRNNGQLGVSFQIPLWSGPGIQAAASQAEADAAQIGIQIRTTRNRVAADTRKAYEGLSQAEAARNITRLDLEVTRDEVSNLLAQMQEGRAAMQDVERARADEVSKWIAFYDATTAVEKARISVLYQLGTVAATLH